MSEHCPGCERAKCIRCHNHTPECRGECPGIAPEGRDVAGWLHTRAEKLRAEVTERTTYGRSDQIAEQADALDEAAIAWEREQKEAL